MRSIQLHVAEDNPADLAWLRLVLNALKLEYNLTVAIDGEEAEQLLTRQGKYQRAPAPDLILLDMKMPKLDGPQVLNQVPGSEKLPICIVSSTDRKSIEDQIPRHRHCSYLSKPVDSQKLLECFRSHEHLKPSVNEIWPSAGPLGKSTAR